MQTEEPLYRQLIDTANGLLKSEPVTSGNIRRAVSTAYYAQFHFLCHTCADQIVGADAPTRRAWRDAYRAVNHKSVDKFCGSKSQKPNSVLERFPTGIVDFAMSLYALKKERHRADYHPEHEFEKSEAEAMIEQVEQTVQNFTETDAAHRTAFVAYVLFPQRV